MPACQSHHCWWIYDPSVLLVYWLCETALQCQNTMQWDSVHADGARILLCNCDLPLCLSLCKCLWREWFLDKVSFKPRVKYRRTDKQQERVWGRKNPKNVIKVKVKVWILAMAPLTWVRLVTSTALQSRKWQLIGMCQWCCSALCGYLLLALTDNMDPHHRPNQPH